MFCKLRERKYMKHNYSLKVFRASMLTLFAALAISSVSLLATNRSQGVKADSLNETSESIIPDTAIELDSTSEIAARVTSQTSTPTTVRLALDFKGLRTTAYSNSDKHYYIAVTDSTFPGESEITNQSELTTDFSSLPNFTASAYRGARSGRPTSNIIENQNAILLPEKLRYSKKFFANVDTIATDFMNSEDKTYSKDTVNDYWFKLSENGTRVDAIYIPKTILTVETGAFSNVPAEINGETYKLDLYFEAKEEEITFQDGWKTGAVDSIIAHFEYEYPSKKAREVVYSPSAKEFGETKEVILGYKGGVVDDKQIPESLFSYEYKVKKADGSVVFRHGSFQVKDANNPYDAISSGSTTFTTSLSLDVEKGEEFDVDSLWFYNIHPLLTTEVDNEQIYYPDVNTTYKLKATKTTKIYDITKIIDYKFKSISVFGDYTSIHVNIDRVFLGEDKHTFYQELREKDFKTYEKQIASGKYIVRYKITNVNNSSLVFEYLNKDNVLTTVTKNIYSPVPYILINKDKGNDASFLIRDSKIADDFSIDKMRSLRIDNMSITMELYNTDTGTSVSSGTKLTPVFGYIYLMEKSAVGPKTFNVASFLIFSTLIIGLVYCACTVGLYFYLKNKYKNDEFRRMKTKPYVIKSLIGLLGVVVVTVAIETVLFRIFKISCSYAVYNPLDPFIIGFGIAGLIVMGYFIYFLVMFVRNEKKRKEAIRLKLNEDVDDDGTK